MNSGARRGGLRPARWDGGHAPAGVSLSPVSFGHEKISSLSPGFLLSRANGFRGQAAVKPKLEVVTNIGRPTRTPLFLGAMLQPSRLALVAVVLALAACVRQGAPAPVVHSSSGVAASPAQGAVIGMPRAVQAPADGQIVVRSGESLYVVAQRAGVPVRTLIDANDLRPPYALSGGQRLNVPRQAGHQVQPGDTLAGIARRYGLGTNELVRANALTPPYAVQVGQVLTLPGAAGPVVAGVIPNPASSLATPPPSPVANAVVPPPAAIERTPARGAVESATLPPSSAVAAAPASVPPLPAPMPVATLPTPAPATALPSPIQPASLPMPQTLAQPDDDEPAARPGRGFLWPVRGSVISDYGAKPGGLQNDGINIAAPRGAAVRAAEAGEVVYAGNELKGFGNLLLVRHKDGWITAYAHADELLVKRGDEVRRGQTIAKVGSTGGVSTPQLHFEIRRGSRPINPRDHLAPQTASVTP